MYSTDEKCFVGREEEDRWVGVVRVKKGGIYIGETKEGRYHGLGDWKENNTVYKGMFREGQREGLGFMHTKKYKYAGRFKRDRRKEWAFWKWRKHSRR